jgi:sarcosine oxidase subunit delta
MLLIDCPHCGPRDETEFTYGGQAHVPYPGDPAALSDKEWAEYLFYRENTRGIFAERWMHSAGCRKWFNALRNTITYEFVLTYPAGTPRPPVPDGLGSPPTPHVPEPTSSASATGLAAHGAKTTQARAASSGTAKNQEGDR